MKAAPLPVLTSPALAAAGLRHAFFTRQGGVSQGLYATLNGGIGSDDTSAAIAENRARMAAHLGVLPARFLSLNQIHSPLCLTVAAPWNLAEPPRADAFVTQKKGIALGVGSADCGPVLFADPVMRIVGAAHAGWKGAKGGVLEATLEAMEALGARRERIIAALGPMLSQAHYEVGPEFLAAFLAEDAANTRFFRAGAQADHPHFDLPGYISFRLACAGVDSIEDLAFCTYAHEERFYSYRRMMHRKEKDYGRMISAIVL